MQEQVDHIKELLMILEDTVLMLEKAGDMANGINTDDIISSNNHFDEFVHIARTSAREAFNLLDDDATPVITAWEEANA